MAVSSVNPARPGTCWPAEGTSAIDTYDCAPSTDEGGPEILYRVTLQRGDDVAHLDAARSLQNAMRRNVQIGGHGQVRDLEKFADATDLEHIGLNIVDGLSRNVMPEFEPRAQLFAERNRNARLFGQPRMAARIIGRHRLLDPDRIEPFEHGDPPQRFAGFPALIGVEHERRISDHGPDCSNPRYILRRVGPSDLDLEIAIARIAE